VSTHLRPMIKLPCSHTFYEHLLGKCCIRTCGNSTTGFILDRAALHPMSPEFMNVLKGGRILL
jgi:hypothetical protein